MLRIYIAGRNGATARVFLNAATGKFSSNEFEPVVPYSMKASTRINCLGALVYTLGELKEKKDNLKGVSAIYTVGMVADAISRGTFKYWLLDGKTSSGEELSQEEIGLWNEFTQLYMELFTNVVIKNISTASLPRTTKYMVTSEMRMDDKYSKLVWDKVPNVEDSQEEVEDAPF